MGRLWRGQPVDDEVRRGQFPAEGELLETVQAAGQQEPLGGWRAAGEVSDRSGVLGLAVGVGWIRVGDVNDRGVVHELPSQRQLN
jgi:hypothetical protein